MRSVRSLAFARVATARVGGGPLLQPTRLRSAPATGGSASRSDGTPEATTDSPRFHVDPRRLPSTIPGVTQEELAEKIAVYYAARSAQAEAQQARAVVDEMEMMRRSLSPEDFEAYVKESMAKRAQAAAEEAKVAAMTPMQLHRYRLQQKRRKLAYEYYKTFVLLLAFFGSTFFIFYLFYFFE